MAKQFSRILVPVSGEEPDDEAVALACNLAKDGRSLISVLYVIQVPRPLPLDAEIPSETAKGEGVLQQMEKIGQQNKRHLEGQIIQARDVGPAVLYEIIQQKVDLVVVGTSVQGRYGTPSLSEPVAYLLKHAPCQVIVSREPQRRHGEPDAE